MAAVTGVTLVKRFNYRGDATEEFSNQYWLSGAVPTGSTPWKALADALIAQEKGVYPADVVVVRAYGYATDVESDPAVWSYDYLGAAATVAGTFPPGALSRAPGDAAMWIRWKTDRLNTKGRPIYLRKYFHGVVQQGNTAPTCDDVATGQKTALTAFATKLRDGTFLDGRLIRSQSHDEGLLVPSVSQYVTTRTLKRRGKRPGS